MLKITRLILKNSPIPFLLRKSKHWHLPGFEGLCLYDVMVFFRKQITKTSLTERAAAISYNIIMALPPSLLFLFTVLPNLPFISRINIKSQLHSLIYDIIPARIHNESIIAFVDDFIDGPKVGLLSFGLIFAGFFASNAMMGIVRSFHKDYHGFKKSKGLSQRWLAIKLTMLIFLLLLVYLFLLNMQGNLLDLIIKNESWKTVILYTRWIFIYLLMFFSIGFIFRYAPPVRERWKLISPGAILTTILCLIASLGFSTFVNYFGKYNALYGTIGTIMMLMALIFINSLALLIGFELNVSIKSLKADMVRRTNEEEKEVTACK